MLYWGCRRLRCVCAYVCVCVCLSLFPSLNGEILCVQSCRCAIKMRMHRPSIDPQCAHPYANHTCNHSTPAQTHQTDLFRILTPHEAQLHLCGEARTVDLLRRLCDMCGDSLQVNEYQRLTPLAVSSKSLDSSLRNVRPGHPTHTTLPQPPTPNPQPPSPKFQTPTAVPHP